ncbi:vegetative cell wall protein gp1 isoform X1 [Drosophila erecta]|uniref:Uncharacterized protein, isoform A n=1 Tax=Drosophila erecta TaxID=7220 RepID=B3NVP8_DROER|nr:vegetative cell wall protein gp1 isoform X1 [Drosophila erecta]EDV46713.2 uncharacterized protein Dere_GG18047, isoform A [Drosophila erecta]
MRMLRLQLLALLVGLLLALISADPVPQDTEVAREKRGTVTLDFGLLLRNLLLKSAQLSSAKANLARTTRRPPTTTTTTPPPPPPPSPIRIRKPIWHPFFSSGFLPRDYDVDYADPPAAQPPAPPPPTAQPPRRVRPQVRPRPRSTTPPPPPPPPPNYDYDYDYDAQPAAPAEAPPPPPPPPPPTAPPRPRPRPRPRPPQPDPQQRRPAQLGDRLIYQYAQPTDTFFRSRAVAEATAAADPDSGDVDGSQADSVADPDAADFSATAAEASSEPAIPPPSAPRFLVNYDSEDDFRPPFAGQDAVQDQGPAGAPGIPASSQGYFPPLELGNLNRFPTFNQQQQYFYN